MTTTAPQHTDDELRAIAAQHEQAAREVAEALERRETERAEATAAIERERDTRLVLAADELEAGLVEAAKVAEAEFTEAVARGDLAAAFGAHVRRKASRPARQGLRDSQRTAEANARTGVRLLAPENLAYDQSRFIEAVEAEGERLSGERGYALAQSLVEQARTGA